MAEPVRKGCPELIRRPEGWTAIFRTDRRALSEDGRFRTVQAAPCPGSGAPRLPPAPTRPRRPPGPPCHSTRPAAIRGLLSRTCGTRPSLAGGLLFSCAALPGTGPGRILGRLLSISPIARAVSRGAALSLSRVGSPRAGARAQL